MACKEYNPTTEKKSCPDCGGSGSRRASWQRASDITCQKCQGTGEIPKEK
jgi:DnaJ-class molecular chaperone